MTRLAMIVALSLAGQAAAQAADVAPARTAPTLAPTSAAPDWTLQVTPYMWAAGLSGNISPFRRAPTLSVEKSFSDVLDELNFGGFLNVWGRYGRFVLSGDIMYVNTSEGKGVGPLPAFQIPTLDVTIPPGAAVSATVDSTQFMASIQGGYRLIDTASFSLDALAGIRVWHISNDVTVAASHPAIGSRSASYGESFGWVDPLVGIRAFLSLTDTLSVQIQADIGGFNVASDLTWSALATVNVVVNDRLSVSAGYKVLDVNYAQRGYVFDTRLSGPVIGATWRF